MFLAAGHAGASLAAAVTLPLEHASTATLMSALAAVVALARAPIIHPCPRRLFSLYATTSF